MGWCRTWPRLGVTKIQSNVATAQGELSTIAWCRVAVYNGESKRLFA